VEGTSVAKCAGEAEVVEEDEVATDAGEVAVEEEAEAITDVEDKVGMTQGRIIDMITTMEVEIITTEKIQVDHIMTIGQEEEEAVVAAVADTRKMDGNETENRVSKIRKTKSVS